MGSSCSSRQSTQDSASVKSEDSQDASGAAPESPAANRTKNNSAREKAKPPDATALRLIDTDFSSGGDEGTGAGTPLSSSMSACAANGSTKGNPPEKGDLKGAQELPDLSRLRDETRLLLTGNVLDKRKPRTRKKMCVVILGRLDVTGERTRQMMNALDQEICERVDEAGCELVLINPYQDVPLLSMPHSSSHLVYRYLKEQSDVSTLLIFVLRTSGVELHELPASLSDSDFSRILDSASDDNREWLQSWFVQDPHNSSVRRLRHPQEVFKGLLSSDVEEYDKAYSSWRKEYRKIIETFADIEDQSKVRLKTTIEQDLDWIKRLPSWIPVKILLLRKDAKRTPSGDQLDHFLEDLGTNEVARETARQISQMDVHFDVVCPTILAEDGTEERWREITSIMISTVMKSMEASLPGLTQKQLNPVEEELKVKLLEEISSHANFTLQNRLSETDGLDKYLNQIQKYLTSSVRKPMLISGPDGAAKTTLASNVAVECSKWNPEACVMARFVGLTSNSTTIDGLLYYLVEHTIATHGYPSPYRCTDMFFSLRTLWQKATSNRQIIVIIDDIDQVTPEWNRFLDSVTELPENVKVILTAQVRTSFRDDFVKKIQNEEFDIQIDFQTAETDKNYLKRLMLTNEQNLSDSTWDKVSKIDPSSRVPLYLLILSQLFLIGTSGGTAFGSTLEEQIKLIITKLRSFYSEVLIESVLGCLCLTRRGLLDQEIVSIIRSSRSSTFDNAFLDWLCLRQILAPILRVRKDNGLNLVSFSSAFTRQVVEKCVLETQERVASCQEILKKCVDKIDDKDILDISLTAVQKERLSHVRALHSSSFLMRPPHEEGSIFFNVFWLFKAIEACGPFGVLEAIDLALCNGQNHELSILREVIGLSSSSLLYDSSQFFSQIYGRLKWRLCQDENCPRLSALLASASESPLPCLLPLSSCLKSNILDKSISELETPTTYFDSIFRIPGHPHYVVAISTGRSQVTVWNIYTMEIVRTLNGINQPKNLEMIDEFKCLLLCGRELRIYDLNKVSFLMKLREVMNQKSPFYGLHDSVHVVALSRSRMYVNMMNLTEGNCVTTFKVGEDRFLNSLLVSENGKICVCGDDSQKPSHLLVWDLQLRKLMYDLRIPHHEFATRLATITTEGHYVCCVCKEVDEPAPNFIVVYDLQSGTLFKRWKPEVNTLSIAISTAGTCVIVGLEDSSVMSFDLITGNRRWTVFGHTYPPDTFRLDSKGLVLLSYDSQGKDNSLKVWEVPTGKSLATLTLDQKMSTCEITGDGKAVVLALEGHDALLTFLLLHKQEPLEVTEKSPPYGDIQHKGKVVDFSQT